MGGDCVYVAMGMVAWGDGVIRDDDSGEMSWGEGRLICVDCGESDVMGRCVMGRWSGEGERISGEERR